MTRPFSSLPLQPTRAGQRRRASLLGCSLGCLVAGCAERYDIGAFGGAPQLQTGDVPPSSAGVGVLLADGVEDADALLEGVKSLAASTSGDFDGDGFDDLIVADTEITSSLHILYGGPRPPDGVVRLAGRSSALGLDEYYYSRSQAFPRHGDFDGDGTDDLVVSVEDRGFHTYGLSGKAAAEQEAALADLVQRWTEMRAFLWKGNPERPAQVKFPSDAVAFRAGDDLSSDLARVLEEHDPKELEAFIGMGLQLSWLGDVDGDGHDDLALSTSFSVTWGREETTSDAVSSFATRIRTESVSYLYYGGARLEAGGEVPPPDARLRGFTLAGLGDVNGDGLADVVAAAPDGSLQLDAGDPPPLYLFPGSPQRLAGEVSVQDLGVPVQISSLTLLGVGDLDGDGIGDLLNWRVHERNQSAVDLVYGSPDLLQRPFDATRVSATFAGRAHQFDMFDGGDYDGDGMSDLFLYTTFWKGYGSDDPLALQPYSDQARLIPGSSTRYAGTYDLDVIQPSREQRGDEWYAALAAAVGDFDGDGRADAVLTNDSDVRIKFGAPLQRQVIR